MFSFFKKRVKEVRVIDKVWLSEEVKFQNIIKRLTAEPDLSCIVWHNETFDKLVSLFPGEAVSARLIIAVQTTERTLRDGPVIFAEHHPSAEKEKLLYQRLGLQVAEVYTSLDEKFLASILPDNFIDKLKRMGIKDDEPIEHRLVSAAIRKAQEKYISSVYRVPGT